MSSAPLMEGTSSCRVPSGFTWSMARPTLTCAGVTTAGLPFSVVNERFISGIALSACARA